PKRQAHLQTLTPLKLVPHTRSSDGKLLYVYADPKGCQCLYVGDEAAYQRYRQLALQQKIAQEQMVAAQMNADAAMDWGLWAPTAGETGGEGDSSMQLGMIGLGRMGANMVLRIMRAGHKCVVYDVHPEAIQALVKEGAVGATPLKDLVGKLDKPRA